MSQFVDIPPLPLKPTRKKKSSAVSEEGPSNTNEHETKFSLDEVLGPPTDLSALNLSLPGRGPHTPGKVLADPHGIFFTDYNYSTRLQRASELHLCPLKHLFYLLCFCNPSMGGSVMNDLKNKQIEALNR